MRAGRSWRGVMLAGCLLAGLAGPAPGVASPGSGPTAVVSLGDSFISGEAGRWQGNSVSPLGDRDGTDRAWRAGDVVAPSGKADVYGVTDADGCHRSDVAPVHAARALGAPYAASVNLACSGADTADVVSSPQKGYPPQVEQLAGVATSHDVRLIVLSIGGNDLGFADIITSCIVHFAAGATVLPAPCHPAEQPKIDAAFGAAMAGVGASIDAIRATMAAAGYGPADYRLVLQSYPSPIPRAADLRYPAGPLRLAPGSCPFTDADATWARDSLVNQIADGLAGVAADRGVEFLDLRALFDGREACARASRQASALSRPSSAASEWVRFIDAGGVHGGETQESFHPNAYGQRAMGACWAALAAVAPGRFACGNVAGAGAERVVLTRTGEAPVAASGPAAGSSAPTPAVSEPGSSSPTTAGPVPVGVAQPARAAKPSRAALAARAKARRRALARCRAKERPRARKACRRAVERRFRR